VAYTASPANIAYVLMIGVLGLISIAAPGHIVSARRRHRPASLFWAGGVAGEFIGITLIVLGDPLRRRVKDPHGILGISGVVASCSAAFCSSILGRLCPGGRPVLVVMAVLAVAFFTLVVTKVRAAFRRLHATGLAALVGRQDGALASRPRGTGAGAREIWKARTRRSPA
jgi:hypothetical protein